MNERIKEAIDLTKQVLGDACRGARMSAVLSLAGRIVTFS